jgi:hypothetical protein
MNAHNEIQDELKELGSTLALMPKCMPYAVPEGYFGGLTADIYSVVSGSLDRMSIQGAGVPEGYFERLPQQMLTAAKRSGKRSMLVALTSHIRWAAAAVLIICMGVGSYITFVDRPANNPEALLSSVSASDIHAYLQAGYRMPPDHNTSHNAHVDDLEVGHSEIVQYLNETGWE